MGDERAFRAEQDVGRVNTFFPILPALGNRWAARRPWEGRTVGLNLHLTTLTASLVRELTLGGGNWVVSAANPGTTDPAAVDLIRNLGVEVYTGGDMENRHLQVLDHQPELLVDNGFALSGTLLDHRAGSADKVRATVEMTRNGIAALRQRREVPFPVVNIHDGRLKEAVENRHGVGEGIWQAVAQLTGMHLAGRRVAVVGYGPVGRGLAAYARAAGTSIEVVETDPVRRLSAHYDGYPTPSLQSALRQAGVVVTATGRAGVLTLDHLQEARQDLVLVNAGHGGNEIDVAGIERAAIRVDHIADQVVRYRLENGRRLTLLGHGHPLNIVLNAGSPEPVLLHFAVLGLTLEWLASSPDLPSGEVLVGHDIENRAALLALEALDPTGA